VQSAIADLVAWALTTMQRQYAACDSFPPCVPLIIGLVIFLSHYCVWQIACRELNSIFVHQNTSDLVIVKELDVFSVRSVNTGRPKYRFHFNVHCLAHRTAFADYVPYSSVFFFRLLFIPLRSAMFVMVRYSEILVKDQAENVVSRHYFG